MSPNFNSLLQLLMNKPSRSSSYDSNKYHLKAMMNNTRMILTRGLSNHTTKEQKSVSKEFQPILRMSGPYIPKEKVAAGQNYTEINKSADIGYFLEKQKASPTKQQEEKANINIVYIGQIQALERRKFGRKNFYRKLKVDKQFKDTEELASQQKNEDSYFANKSKNESMNQSQIQIQTQLEELHYELVRTYQMLKNRQDY